MAGQSNKMAAERCAYVILGPSAFVVMRLDSVRTLTLLIYIWYVPGSNLGRGVEYPEFLYYLSQSL
jgi:hypothetical protein